MEKLIDRNSDEPRATSWRKCLLALLFTVGMTVATFAVDVRAENPHAMGFAHRSKAKPKAPLIARDRQDASAASATITSPKAISIARDRRDPPANGTASPPPEATSMTAGRGGVHHVLHSWHVCSSTWPVGTKTRGKITIEDLVRSAWKRDLRPRTLALSDICHKDQTGNESESVDTYCARQQGSAKRAGRGPADVPGIVVESRANPCGARFTMLDGAHRICRLKQGGAAAGRFFVFDVASAEALVTSERAPGKRRPQPRFKTLSRDDAMDLAWWLAERHYDVAG